MERIGTLRVADYAEYGDDRSGYVIERFAYFNQREPMWAIPAWDEQASDLEGPFQTREAAEAALLEWQGAA